MKKEETTITKESNQVIQFPVSLRDWFAGQVISGSIINCVDEEIEIAISAYKIADAMIAERGEGKIR